jgi:hypothetical protein
VSATVTVNDQGGPKCTVTVRLSIGGSKSYRIDKAQRLPNPNSRYVFFAVINPYRVTVTMTLDLQGKCAASLSNLVHL